MSDKKELMKRIRDEIWDFKESPLYAERMANKVFPVIGEGSHDAEVMFVGEAPGKNEAATGRPFCGASGKVLDKLLESIGIKRETVYITNVVKDRPTNNRDPKPEEIELYAPFLDRQVEIIQPKIIATLGRFSMDYLMKRFGLTEKLNSISKIHGQVFETEFKGRKLSIIPLYHPAVAVYNANMLDSLKKDFEAIKKNLKKGGFTLIETLVGVAVFTIIAVSAYGGFAKLIESIQLLRIKNSAMQIANEQMEIIRNLPYADVGLVGGLPIGKIPSEKSVVRENTNFEVLTTIRNIDDPFDGLIGETPNDLSPADYKLVEVSVACTNCKFTKPMVITGQVAPKNLETQGNNGALFVKVIDASGRPVPEANIRIENIATTTQIIIQDKTNNNGLLQIVDAPPGVSAYYIQVSKPGYSSDKTYAIGDSSNPVPAKPHANVISGQVTQLTFSIDKLSELNIYSKTENCDSVGDVGFNMEGTKTIGLDKLKFDRDFVTGSDGLLNLPTVEWDDYLFRLIDSDYDLAGTNPFLPANIQPDSLQSLDLIVKNKSPKALLVVVKDAGTGLPVSDAEVTLTRSGSSKNITTGRGVFNQTDWSVGSGQEKFGDLSRYFTSDGGVDSAIVPGEIRLAQNGSYYTTSGYLISSIFDAATSTNFHTLSWMPFDQPALAGNESVRFQIATASELTPTTTWNYRGPSGTASSFYTVPGTQISGVDDNQRYIRYKMFLSTNNNQVTPSVSDVAITYSTNCAPPGQVLFDSLSNAAYLLRVTKNGYQTYSSEINISSDWQTFEVELSP